MKLSKEILTIDSWDNEVKLSERADEINLKTGMVEAREIIKALKDTINEKGITALSAPAIGYNKRIFCIKFKEEIKTFINPIICKCDGITLSTETCTSIPNKRYIRPRNSDLTFMYQRPTGQIETRQVAGITAYIVQHEIDHLDGIILPDIGLEIDDAFDNATEEERLEVINDYLESLDVKEKELNKEIKNDPELNELSQGIKFISGVESGDVVLENKEDVT